MSAWIGPLGNLIEFKCPSAVESQSDDPHVYFRPLGGSVSTTVLGDPTRPRVWNVSVSAARPDQVSELQRLTEGQFGPGPFVFIPPGAQTLNLLGKRDALGMGTPPYAYVPDAPGATITQTTEGIAGSGYKTLTGDATPTAPMGDAPVIPGVRVTGKAWVRALPGITGSLRLQFYSAGHTVLANSAGPVTTSTAGEFLSVTHTAPPGSAYARVIGAGAYITQLQVTWTDAPRTWSPSAASTNVVVSPLSNSVRRATGRPGEEQITDHTFTVQELSA